MSRSMPELITESVAAAEGIDPIDLDFVLEDCIDTDALEQLVRFGGATWTLSFRCDEYVVTLTSRREIFVDEAREQIPSV